MQPYEALSYTWDDNEQAWKHPHKLRHIGVGRHDLASHSEDSFRAIRGVRTMDELSVWRHDYFPTELLQGWYQDLNPGNSLVIRDSSSGGCQRSFKLADLGLCNFNNVLTLQHGLPEYNPFDPCSAIFGRDSANMLAVGLTKDWDDFEHFRAVRQTAIASQSVDIWCLGCILTEAVTWLDKTSSRPNSKTANEEIVSSIVWNMLHHGEWNEVEDHENKVLHSRLMALEDQNPATIASIINLATRYWKLGGWVAAEVLHERALEISLHVLGEGHSLTMTAMANLASTYWSQGRWKEGEEMDLKVVEARSRVFGENDPRTLTAIANLASTYWSQGRWDEAEELEIKVIHTRSRVLGEDHPDTMTTVANLASTYFNQGRWDNAQGMFQWVLQIRKAVMGIDHPDTLSSMSNLASTYWNQHHWEDAEELFVKVVEAREIMLGPGHPDTLNAMNNLALTYSCQGRFLEAEEMQARAVKGYKQSCGLDHPNTLAATATLAHIRRNHDPGASMMT